MQRDQKGSEQLLKTASGIRGLDEITQGGFPQGRPILICGGPGCGKTLFGMEFLVRGALDYGEPGVLMSFEESSADLAKNVASLGFDLSDLVKRKLLAPIKSTLEVMRLTGSADATFSWGRTLINRQVEHMTRLVDDLLDVSRLTQGKIVLQKKLVSLNEVVERALEASRPLIDSHKHRLTISLPSEEVYFDADPVRLAQVVSNLLNNSAKYTQEGGLIDVTATPTDGELVLRVNDNGRGIPADVLPRVFDLFIQADQSLAHSQGGLGIGLTLVRSLAQMHGGMVAVESEGLGKGSCFIVRLPVVRALPGGIVPQRTAPPVAKASGYRILLIDDNVDAVESLGLLLQMSGHEVRKALDGLTAIKVAREFEPQIVLCDIGLPGTDGYEVIRRLREQASEATPMPIMAAITGYGKAEDMKRTQEAGFDYHFVKPIDIEDLQRLIAEQEPPFRAQA
ncbi:MAG: response regulator [Burkholderiales bacterium]|nr:response regulator [Burkholderiales bacterium]